MNVLLWVVQALLAVTLVAVGALKILRPKDKLAATFGWVEQFSTPAVKTIGALDALAGLGLILPAAVNIAPILVPIAALGGIALVIGGSIVHLRRSETSLAAMNVIYLVLLALVAWGRFGPYHF